MRAAGMHHAWVSLYVITMLSWLPCALATPFIVRLARRFPPMQLRPLSAWGAHLAACVAVATVFSGWSAFMFATWNPYLLEKRQPFLGTWGHKFCYEFLSTLILYAFVLMVSFVLDAR